MFNCRDELNEVGSKRIGSNMTSQVSCGEMIVKIGQVERWWKSLKGSIISVFSVHYPFYDGVYKCNQPAFATAFN